MSLVQFQSMPPKPEYFGLFLFHPTAYLYPMNRIFPLTQKIFQEHNSESFERLSLEIFRFQYQNIPVYKQFVDALNIIPENINRLDSIPFMPIEFFKNFQIIQPNHQPEIVFKSSGTTGMQRSQHFVYDIKLYESSFSKGFNLFYGPENQYIILALLPSYLENGESSLVYMVDYLIKKTGNENCGFYLNEPQLLQDKLHQLKSSSKKILLLGVSYALLDMAEILNLKIPNLIVMETGGMKGRRKEMVRDELHGHLTKGFGVSNIHSEYGMTELLSQAYSKGKGIFSCPPWMKMLIRDTYDPLSYVGNGKSGAINIIDLANIHSVSFIATQDLGKITGNNEFEILGRFDHSDVRGCNLLVG